MYRYARSVLQEFLSQHPLTRSRSLSNETARDPTSPQDEAASRKIQIQKFIRQRLRSLPAVSGSPHHHKLDLKNRGCNAKPTDKRQDKKSQDIKKEKVFFLYTLLCNRLLNPFLDLITPGLKREDQLSNLTDFRKGKWPKTLHSKGVNVHYSRCLEEPTPFNLKKALEIDDCIIKDPSLVFNGKIKRKADSGKFLTKFKRSVKHKAKDDEKLKDLSSLWYKIFFKRSVDSKVESLTPNIHCGHLGRLCDFRAYDDAFNLGHTHVKYVSDKNTLISHSLKPVPGIKSRLNGVEVKDDKTAGSSLRDGVGNVLTAGVQGTPEGTRILNELKPDQNKSLASNQILEKHVESSNKSDVKLPTSSSPQIKVDQASGIKNTLMKDLENKSGISFKVGEDSKVLIKGAKQTIRNNTGSMKSIPSFVKENAPAKTIVNENVSTSFGVKTRKTTNRTKETRKTIGVNDKEVSSKVNINQNNQSVRRDASKSKNKEENNRRVVENKSNIGSTTEQINVKHKGTAANKTEKPLIKPEELTKKKRLHSSTDFTAPNSLNNKLGYEGKTSRETGNKIKGKSVEFKDIDPKTSEISVRNIQLRKGLNEDTSFNEKRRLIEKTKPKIKYKLKNTTDKPKYSVKRNFKFPLTAKAKDKKKTLNKISSDNSPKTKLVTFKTTDEEPYFETKESNNLNVMSSDLINIKNVIESEEKALTSKHTKRTNFAQNENKEVKPENNSVSTEVNRKHMQQQKLSGSIKIDSFISNELISKQSVSAVDVVLKHDVSNQNQQNITKKQADLSKQNQHQAKNQVSVSNYNQIKQAQTKTDISNHNQHPKTRKETVAINKNKKDAQKQTVLGNEHKHHIKKQTDVSYQNQHQPQKQTDLINYTQTKNKKQADVSNQNQHHIQKEADDTNRTQSKAKKQTHLRNQNQHETQNQADVSNKNINSKVQMDESNTSTNLTGKNNSVEDITRGLIRQSETVEVSKNTQVGQDGVEASPVKKLFISRTSRSLDKKSKPDMLDSNFEIKQSVFNKISTNGENIQSDFKKHVHPVGKTDNKKTLKVPKPQFDSKKEGIRLIKDKQKHTFSDLTKKRNEKFDLLKNEAHSKINSKIEVVDKKIASENLKPTVKRSVSENKLKKDSTTKTAGDEKLPLIKIATVKRSVSENKLSKESLTKTAEDKKLTPINSATVKRSVSENKLRKDSSTKTAGDEKLPLIKIATVKRSVSENKLSKESLTKTAEDNKLTPIKGATVKRSVSKNKLSKDSPTKTAGDEKLPPIESAAIKRYVGENKLSKDSATKTAGQNLPQIKSATVKRSVSQNKLSKDSPTTTAGDEKVPLIKSATLQDIKNNNYNFMNQADKESTNLWNTKSSDKIASLKDSWESRWNKSVPVVEQNVNQPLEGSGVKSNIDKINSVESLSVNIKTENVIKNQSKSATGIQQLGKHQNMQLNKNNESNDTDINLTKVQVNPLNKEYVDIRASIFIKPVENDKKHNSGDFLENEKLKIKKVQVMKTPTMSEHSIKYVGHRSKDDESVGKSDQSNFEVPTNDYARREENNKAAELKEQHTKLKYKNIVQAQQKTKNSKGDESVEKIDESNFEVPKNDYAQREENNKVAEVNDQPTKLKSKKISQAQQTTTNLKENESGGKSNKSKFEVPKNDDAQIEENGKVAELKEQPAKLKTNNTSQVQQKTKNSKRGESVEKIDQNNFEVPKNDHVQREENNKAAKLKEQPIKLISKNISQTQQSTNNFKGGEPVEKSNKAKFEVPKYDYAQREENNNKGAELKEQPEKLKTKNESQQTTKNSVKTNLSPKKSVSLESIIETSKKQQIELQERSKTTLEKTIPHVLQVKSMVNIQKDEQQSKTNELKVNENSSLIKHRPPAKISAPLLPNIKEKAKPNMEKSKINNTVQSNSVSNDQKKTQEVSGQSIRAAQNNINPLEKLKKSHR